MQIRLLQLPTNIYIWLPDWLPSLPCGPLFDHRHLAVLILLPRLSTNLGKLWTCCNTERRRASGKLWKWMWSGFMLWSRHFYPCYKLATKRLSSTSPLDLGHYLGDMRRWSYHTSCYCILIVYSLYTHCIRIVYSLYAYCILIVYLPYTHIIVYSHSQWHWLWFVIASDSCVGPPHHYSICKRGFQQSCRHALISASHECGRMLCCASCWGLMDDAVCQQAPKGVQASANQPELQNI